jgi:single-strand DNA-binding protein
MNKVILMGRLTKDPEIRYTQTSKAVANFTIAVSRRFKKDEADFINCVAWEKTAEFISKYFSKGGMIAVVGSIQTRTWDDEDGKRHYVTEVVAEEAYFTGERNNSRPEPQDDRFEPLDDDELPF